MIIIMLFFVSHFFGGDFNCNFEPFFFRGGGAVLRSAGCDKQKLWLNFCGIFLKFRRVATIVKAKHWMYGIFILQHWLFISLRIHVWYIYLHLVDFYGKCRQIYHTWILRVFSIRVNRPHIEHRGRAGEEPPKHEPETHGDRNDGLEEYRISYGTG